MEIIYQESERRKKFDRKYFYRSYCNLFLTTAVVLAVPLDRIINRFLPKQDLPIA